MNNSSLTTCNILNVLQVVISQTFKLVIRMINQTSKFLFIIWILLLSACQSEEKSQKNSSLVVIPVPAEQISDIQLSNFMELEDVITLDTTREAIIGEITKILWHKDKIYISDRAIAKCIFVFDAQGRFIRKIGQAGDAKGSYISLEDFLIEDSHLIVLDAQASRLVFHDLTTGDFVKYEKISFPAFCFSFTEDFNYYLGASREDKLIVTDKNNQRLRSYFPFYKKSRSILPQHFSFTNKGALHLFHKSLCDTIFSLQQGEMQAAYFFDFGDRAFTDERFAKLSEEKKERPALDEKGAGNILFFAEGADNCYATFIEKGNFSALFYEKETRKTYSFRANRIQNDISYTSSIPIFLSESASFLWAAISADQKEEILKNFREKNIKSSPKAMQKLYEAVNSLQKDDNPLLIKVRLK
jgi:hypothetical protein